MSKKLLACICLLPTLFVANSYADSPNKYTCTGKNVSLTFFPNGPGGAITIPPTPQNLLTLNIGNNKYTAGKAGIETHNTPMGIVKTITTKILPDVDIQKASFILPEISLGTNFAGQFVDKANFSGWLALTTVATPFVAPNTFVGIIEKSSYVNLACTAEIVLFPL